MKNANKIMVEYMLQNIFANYDFNDVELIDINYDTINNYIVMRDKVNTDGAQEFVITTSHKTQEFKLTVKFITSEVKIMSTVLEDIQKDIDNVFKGKEDVNNYVLVCDVNMPLALDHYICGYYINRHAILCSKCYSVGKLTDDMTEQGIYHCEQCGRDQKFNHYNDLILIDEMIAAEVSELNKLGFETKYSCSGHTNDPFGYIRFTKKYEILENIVSECLQDKLEVDNEVSNSTTTINHIVFASPDAIMEAIAFKQSLKELIGIYKKRMEG